MADALVEVEVCFARPDSVFLRTVTVSAGTTLLGAIEASGLPQAVPGLNLQDCKLGVYGKTKPAQALVRSGDRIEIYRPLLADPKDARRRRAVKATRAANRGAPSPAGTGQDDSAARA
ncbi:MAG: RnfH family protein [Paucimonas sp.]|nr:RnfH family protein [Paucimonas sp.]